MSTDDMNHRLRDPFYTSPLPRTYYHPSPNKDVDSGVVIQSPEKNNQSSRKSELENPFETGSTFKLSALPQLKSVHTRTHLSHMSDGMDEMYSRSEQASNSTLLDTTQLTSSIDEKERATSTDFLSHQKEDGQGGSISTIQKYIDRFRYSAPKSREEREKEKAQKKNTFWWMNSDAPQKPKEKGPSARPSLLEHTQESWKPENTAKLTREAILELDKETSYIQQKADKLLTKSQLSLVSSGPCVSTDGLGSSTALSECSYKTDQQPPYRPIFVNLQGNYGEAQRDPVAPKQKFQAIEEEHPMSPQDALARWRRRRLMDETQKRSVKLPTTHKPMKTHVELDFKLEEFRKKLFSQRTLITSEDIQFERQKMKMILDDDEDHKENTQSHKIEVSQSKDNSQHSSALPQEDLVLSRLRKITRMNELPNAENSLSYDHPNDSDNQTYERTSLTERVLSFNSNNANTTQDRNGFSVDPCFSDQLTLNRNNTASSQRAFDSQEMENCCIDEMTSIHLCDARQQKFVLNSNAVAKNDSQALKENKADTNRNLKNLSRNSENKLKAVDKSQCEESFANSNIETSPRDSESFLDQNTHYHQRLEAEKPCGETDKHRNRQPRQDCHDNHSSNSSIVGKSDGYESENSVSSKKSELREMPTHSKKKSKNRTRDSKHVKYSNEEELSDTSSKKSDRSATKSTFESTSRINANNQDGQILINNDAKSELAGKDVGKDHEGSKQPDRLLRKEAPAPRHVEKANISLSPQPNNIHRVIGETVMDHFFDGPSMISSVDSWASLFPRSPSHSLYNSTVVTPTKESSSSHQTAGSCSLSPSQRTPAASPSKQTTMTSTPQSGQIASGHCEESGIGDTADNGDGNKDTCVEFESDPLMNLLQQQKNEYLHKLELIELKLQQFGDESS